MGENCGTISVIQHADNVSISAAVGASNEAYRSKFLVEFVLLAICLILVLALSIIIAALLFVPTRGRIFFTQKRIGRRGREFTLYKFKTLNRKLDLNIEKDNAQIRAATIPFGRILRRTGLDELPQFINVIKRDMNIIGPRAFLEKDLKHLSAMEYILRHKIRPGITGLWQVTRNYDERDLDFMEPDLHYINNGSPMLDIDIIKKTLGYILSSKGV